LECSAFTRRFGTKLSNYDTPIPHVAPPTEQEIKEHEQEERGFLSCVTEEKPEQLPLEMRLKEKPAEWRLWFTNIATESKLRYLTAADVMCIVVFVLLTTVILVTFVCRDIRKDGYDDGYRQSTYSKISKHIWYKRGRQNDDQDVIIVYIDRADMDAAIERDYVKDKI
jgi:hypothetical protein